MTNQTPDWTQFTKRIRINKPMDTVYAAWAKPGQLIQWFLEEAEYTDPNEGKRASDELIQKGDHHRWKWHNWDFHEEGLVMEANGKDFLSFTFGQGGNVHIHLKEDHGGTEVKLVQDKIPTDEAGKMSFYVGCSTGWTFWLANLKAWLEHGIKLNATGLKQEETTNLVNS